MGDADKTKEQLIDELGQMRQRITQLEALEVERRQAEEALRESEERYRALFERSSEAVFLLDVTTGCYLDANAAAERLTGRSVSELRTLTTRDVVPSGAADRLQQLVAMQDSIEFGEVNYVRPNGDSRTALLSAVRLSKDYVFSTARDITERKQAEAKLKESERRFRQLFEGVSDAIMVLGLEGRFIDCNEITLQYLGYNREEFLCLTSADIVHPDFHELMKGNQQKLWSGKSVVFESMHLTKDGREIPVEAKAHQIEYGGEPAILVVVQDVTERKQAEKREKALQQELNLSSRLASIGELAAGVAHEINNPLTGILGFSERLLRKSTDEEIRQGLERIHNEAQQASRIVESLRTFARRREIKKEHLDINDILARTLELGAYELRTGNIDPVVELAPDIPKIIGDFGQIQQVFLNIILNAEQAMTEANGRGKLIIKTEERQDCIRISFVDNGPGIPAEHLDRIFDPFFTTRGEKGGTGLGLSACHGIVTEHGGKIYAKSKPGRGATFFVELPAAATETGK